MKRILELKTIDEVRIMTDPYRTKIILIFQKHQNQPITVKMIANEMDEPHGKVYYHVKKMLGIGALELAKTEKFNGITAKYYQLTFDEMKATYDSGNVVDKEEVASSYSQLIANYFDQYRDHFTDFISRVEHKDYDYKPGEDTSFVTGEILHFNEKSYAMFQKDLKSLIEKYTDQLEGEDAFKKTIFCALFSEYENNKDK